ncbi:NuoL/Nad5 family protein [Gimesia fumaroli]|uniref:NADH:ubiquinone oxidoreductase subunit L n=1 Tax=Gimesia fumaroli TaxID=2527976 RepID=A0A518I6U5_9PLAN|nr:hypothetical protein [Gimesia fumaroli]QDV48821.1 NADH:ubiquinone oxidoreductase subunit L [Gimesia fumaroli]
MDKTITLLLQLSLITPFVMVLVAALVGFRILKGRPHWPALIGVVLTTMVAVTSVFYFRSRLQSQSYSRTLIDWLSLGSGEEGRLSIGVLLDPLSLAFFLLISLASLFYLLLDHSFSTVPAPRSRRQFTSLLYLLSFFATAGIVLATNFLQLFLFWLMLSMSMNLLHEVNLPDESPQETEHRHWWGWNAFSDGMLLLAIFLISVNFQSLHFLTCLQPDAIQAAFTQNRVALPGIGAALFLAALPRLNLFPASALIVCRQTPWNSSSLATLSLLSLPAGLFLLLRTAPYFFAIQANQRLLLQLGTLSAFLTLFSAISLTRGQQRDRVLYWLSATMAGMTVAILGMSRGSSLHLILALVLLQTSLFAVLIPIQHRLQEGTLPLQSMGSIQICVLLLLTASVAGLGTMLNPLIAARAAAQNLRSELMVWLMLFILAGYVFGLARFYFFLNARSVSSDSRANFPVLPLWGITVLICLTSVSVYVRLPIFPQLWPALMTGDSENPFDRDWLFCSLFCVMPLVALVLAWMTASKTDRRKPDASPEPALIQLGQSHYYSLTLLNRALIHPLQFCAKFASLLDEWIVTLCSRFSLETLPEYWGQLLKQMQNGQTAFQTLVLLFTLSILIFVLMVLQI